MPLCKLYAAVCIVSMQRSGLSSQFRRKKYTNYIEVKGGMQELNCSKNKEVSGYYKKILFLTRVVQASNQISMTAVSESTKQINKVHYRMDRMVKISSLQLHPTILKPALHQARDVAILNYSQLVYKEKDQVMEWRSIQRKTSQEQRTRRHAMVLTRFTSATVKPQRWR